jgi:hypothetical protein
MLLMGAPWFLRELLRVERVRVYLPWTQTIRLAGDGGIFVLVSAP